MTQINKVSYFKATVVQRKALKKARINYIKGKILTLRELKSKLRLYE